MKAQPGKTLKSAGRATTGTRERFATQHALVVTQIAVSLTLLVGALLFIRSFTGMLTFNPGMRESDITLAFLAFDNAHVSPGRYLEFQRQLLDDVKATPGVIDAGSTTMIPLLGGSWEHGVHVGPMEGTSKFTWVSPGYFGTMGIPLIAGRGFSQADTRSSRRVAIVNQTFVRKFLRAVNPIGRTLRTVMEPSYPSTLYEIVGVIPDTKYNSLRGETPPMSFAPASQYPDPSSFEIVLIHSKIAPKVLIATLKREFERRYPAVVVTRGDFQRSIRDGMVQERAMAMLSGFFGLVAAVLAVIGLYGVISYVVAARRNELGVRMALGASRTQVIGLVLRQVWMLLAAGVFIGIALSMLAGRVASALLFNLTAYDPLTLMWASLLLIAISSTASFVPARRASKIDPMIALRYE